MSANAHEYNTDTVNRDHVKIMKRLLWFFCKLCKRLFCACFESQEQDAFMALDISFIETSVVHN